MRVRLMFEPEFALRVLRDQYDEECFISGNCHHLALALFESASNTGRLIACLRNHVDADTGEIYLRNYSHMCWQAPDGALWDIDGPDAAARWESQFDNIDTPDADNLLSGSNWMDLQPAGLPAFVEEWDNLFYRPIVEEVKEKIDAAMKTIAAL